MTNKFPKLCIAFGCVECAGSSYFCDAHELFPASSKKEAIRKWNARNPTPPAESELEIMISELESESFSDSEEKIETLRKAVLLILKGKL